MAGRSLNLRHAAARERRQQLLEAGVSNRIRSEPVPAAAASGLNGNESRLSSFLGGLQR